MALDGTYAGLQASIAAWIDRDDLAALIPDFIALAEIRLNDRLRLAPMETAVTLQPVTVAGSLTDELTGNPLVDEITGAPITPESVSGGGLTDETTGNPLTDETTGNPLDDEAGSGVITGAIGTISAVALPADFVEMRRLVANTSPATVLRLAAPGWASDAYYTLASWPDVYTIINATLLVYPSSSATLTLAYYARIPALSNSITTNWLLKRYPNMYLYAALLEAVPVLYDDSRAALWKQALDQAIADAEMSDMGTRWSNATMRLPGATP